MKQAWLIKQTHWLKASELTEANKHSAFTRTESHLTLLTRDDHRIICGYSVTLLLGLMHAFLTSGNEYCNSILYGKASELFNEFQYVQNSAARAQPWPHQPRPPGSPLALCPTTDPIQKSSSSLTKLHNPHIFKTAFNVQLVSPYYVFSVLILLLYQHLYGSLLQTGWEARVKINPLLNAIAWENGMLPSTELQTLPTAVSSRAHQLQQLPAGLGALINPKHQRLTLHSGL